MPNLFTEILKNLKPEDPKNSNMVEHDIAQIIGAREIGKKAYDLRTISQILAIIKQDILPSIKIHEAHGINFDFTPPVEIPAFIDEKKLGEDPRTNSACLLIGRKLVDSTLIGSKQSIITEKEFYAQNELAHAQGLSLVAPLSVLGGIFFQIFDQYESIGAVVNGKASNLIRVITLNDISLSINLVRPVLESDPQASHNVSLMEIDSWRLSNLGALGLELKENPPAKELFSDVLSDIVLDKIF